MTEQLGELLTSGSAAAIPLALAAGVVAGLNPCCLPIYPAAAGCCTALRRGTTRGNIGVAVAFVLGGTLVTTVLGVVTGLAGGAFGGLGSWVIYAISLIPFAFGLHMLGVFDLPLPRADLAASREPRGLLGAVVAGALLGLVITPCATPVLATLLTYVAATGDPLWGGLLLFVYGLGIGIPVILVATTAASLVARLSTERARRVAEHVTGVLLVGVGLYLLWIA